MSKRKILRIKRISPPVTKKKIYSIEEILKAAKRVNEAMEKEVKKYGRMEFA